MLLFAVEEFKEKKRNGAVRCRRIQRKEKKQKKNTKRLFVCLFEEKKGLFQEQAEKNQKFLFQEKEETPNQTFVSEKKTTHTTHTTFCFKEETQTNN